MKNPKLNKHKIFENYYFPGDLAKIVLYNGTVIEVESKSSFVLIIKEVNYINDEQV